MKVGFCVEGSSDKWLLHGLRDRWCPDAELIEGRFRGAFKRREIPKACLELRTKGVDMIVLLRDANTENWRDVAKDDLNACKLEDRDLVIVGICDRNVECWLVADAQYAARQTHRAESEFRVADPKEVFNHAMGITRLDDKRDQVKTYVINAPLRRWLANRSFENFYEQIWRKSKDLQCGLENLRDSGCK